MKLTSEETIASFLNGNISPIEDNSEYNKLLLEPTLFGKVNDNKYIKIELVGIFATPDYFSGTALIFKTEKEMNRKIYHLTEWSEYNADLIITYDKDKIGKFKNDFKNLNRTAIDYGYSSLEDFLTKFDEIKEQNPERFV